MVFIVLTTNSIIIAIIEFIVLEVAYELIPAFNQHVGCINVNLTVVRPSLSRSSWLALRRGSICGLLGRSLLCIARFSLDGRDVGVGPFVLAGVV